jgi:hypothetical protein
MELALGAQVAGQQEVEKSPELCDVVLNGCPGEDEPMAGGETTHGLHEKCCGF